MQEQSRVSYDKDGNPTYLVDSVTGFTETFTYNSLGMITQRYLYNSALSEAFCEDFIYDDFGKVINYTCNKIVDGNSELVSQYTYTYLDNAARDLDCVNVTNFANFKLKTDVFGRYTGKEIKNSNNTTIEDCTISYLEVNGTLTNLPASITYTNPNTNQSTTLAYTYDARGNIIEVRENGTLIEQYTYDTLNRLATEVNTKLCINKTYTYDVNGNETSDGYYTNDKLTSTPGLSNVSYDQMGNLTQAYSEEYYWSKNRFVGTYSSYIDATYDGFGRRYTKTHNRSGDFIKFIYDSQDRLLQSTNGLTFIYDFTGVAGFKYNGNNYYYRKDILGNVIALLNGNGTLVATYVYDAWGNHYAYDSDNYIIYDQTNVAHVNPFRYRSYYFDEEFDLYYLISRYYSPSLGRFISPDIPEYLDPSTPNGLNLYTYCNNNPIMYVDPSGHIAISTLLIISAIITGVCVVGGAAMGGVSAGMSGGDVGDVFTGIGKGALNGLILGGGISLAVCGLGIGGTTIIGSIMTSYGLSISANMLEVAITQGKKSYYDGDNFWAGANDINRAMFANSGNILIGKPTLMSIPFYGTRMTSKIPTIFNVYLSYQIDKLFDSTPFLASAKATLLEKASPLGLIAGYGLTALQYYYLIKAIVTTPDFENSPWILY